MTVLREAEEFTAAFQTDILKPVAEADMTFSSLPSSIIAQCQSYGEVII